MYHFYCIKLLIKKRSDRLKNRSKSPVKIQLSLGRFSIKIPNFGKIFLDFLSNSCSGDPPSSSREESSAPPIGVSQKVNDFLGFFRCQKSQLFGDFSIYLLGINDYLDDYLGGKKSLLGKTLFN